MGAHVRQDNVIVLRLWRYVSHVLTYLLTYLPTEYTQVECSTTPLDILCKHDATIEELIRAPDLCRAVSFILIYFNRCYSP